MFGEKVDVDEDVAEEDVLFKSDDRETYNHVAERVRAVSTIWVMFSF